MSTTLTKLGVWNLALDLIREAPLQSLTEPAAAARWLERNWAHTVDINLQKYNWDFARERFALNKDVTDPAFKWSHRYHLPNGTLRVLPFYPGGDETKQAVRHEVLGNYIETNEASPLYVSLIMRRMEPGGWSPLFAEVVRLSLALGLAGKFPGKARYLAELNQRLREATDLAEEIETFQGSSEPVEQHDIIRVRER